MNLDYDTTVTLQLTHSFDGSGLRISSGELQPLRVVGRSPDPKPVLPVVSGRCSEAGRQAGSQAIKYSHRATEQEKEQGKW